MSFFQKLLGAFAFLVILAGLLGFLGTQQIAGIGAASYAQRHSAETLDALAKVAAKLGEMQSSVRAHLLGGDDKFLDTYKAADNAYRAAFSELQDLANGNDEQQGRIDELRRLADSWRTEIAPREITLAARADSMEEARQFDVTTGAAAWTAIARKLAEIDTAQREFVSGRTASLKRAIGDQDTFLLFAAGGLVAAVAVVGLILILVIVQPVSRITRAMWEIAKGDLSVAVPGLGRTDEAGEMAQIVDVFKRSAEENDRLRSAQQFFEQRLKDEKRQAVQNVARAFETKVGTLMASLGNSAAQMENTAQSMSATADIANQQAATAAQTAEETVAQVQAILARSSGLASSIKGIGQQATEDIEAHITQVKTATRSVVSAVQGIEAFISEIDEYAETGGQPAPAPRQIIPTGVAHASGDPGLGTVLTAAAPAPAPDSAPPAAAVEEAPATVEPGQPEGSPT